jgi:hypothetical protein
MRPLADAATDRAPSPSIALAERLALLVAVALFAAVWSYRKTDYPPPWLDEGVNMTTAATLARSHLYALPDSAGPRIMDASIQTGPTVLLPVAVVLRLFGINLLNARLAMLPFAAVALAAFIMLAVRLNGLMPAALASVLLAVGTWDPRWSFAFMSRQVMGEVPSIGFYLVGLLLWLRALERSKSGWLMLVAAGLAWGAAMVTKSQMLMLAPLALGLVALLDVSYYHRAGWRAFILPGMIAVGCVVAWYLTQITLAGMDTFLYNARGWREGVGSIILSVNPLHWRTAAGILQRTGFIWWGVPGIVWGINRARQKSALGFAHAAGLAFPAIALAWFALFSVGWERYAIYYLSLVPIWTAGLVVNLMRRRLLPGPRILGLIAGAAILLLYAVCNAVPTAAYVATPSGSGYPEMVKYLGTQVRKDAVIESWEWEAGLETRQRIHHPSNPIFLAYTVSKSNQTPPPTGLYDVREAHPDYILIGLYGRYTGIYDQVLAADGDLVATFGTGFYGEYSLYRLRRAGG